MSTIVNSYIERTQTGINYEVKVDGCLVWSKLVRFGKSKATRAGGSAFRDASLEQDSVYERELGKASQ